MKPDNKELNRLLEKTVNEIRGDDLDAAAVAGARDRVSATLFSGGAKAAITGAAAHAIESCSDFQELIPAYLAGELSQARSLLFHDHTLECVPCRRALKNARLEPAARQIKAAVTSRRVSIGKKNPMIRWAIAAVVVVGLGLVVFPLLQRYSPFRGSLETTVLAAEGPVYKVGSSGNTVLATGAKIQRGEVVRTSLDGHAILGLADGSTLELGDRSELSIDKTGTNTTVHLGRGNLIVQPRTKQTSGLYVSTDDALITVNGAISSVSSGLKGSHVASIRGGVQLDHEGKQTQVGSGEQASTSSALQSTSIEDTVKWSANADEYLGMLAQLSALRKSLAGVSQPGVRTSTRLLDLMPDNTVLYAGLPNLGESLAESNRIMESRIDQNPKLREWWDKRESRDHDRAGIDQTVEKIRKFGEVLGDEISVAATMDKQGHPVGPLVAATLKDADGFKRLVDQELKSRSGSDNNGPAVVYLTDLNTPPVSTPGTQHSVYIWIQGDLLIASPELGQLQEVAVRSQSGVLSGFLSTGFHQRIADVYGQGAGILVAADLEKIISSQFDEKTASDSSRKIEGLKQLGVTNLKYFIAEQKVDQQRTLSRAVLGFNPSDHGLTSWLASPGPIGSLDYISPDANIAAAFVVNKPAGLVDDILGFVDTVSPDFSAKLKQIEIDHNVDLRKDIAAPLGGEFAFAIDGPILPTPSWKMVFEVNDPAKLQQTFEHVVAEVNAESSKQGIQMLEWDNSTGGDRIFYRLRSVQFGLEVNYAYINGYLVAAPSRALIDSAIRYHDSGLTLKSSKRFQSALPSDGRAEFSGIIYHDLASLVGPIAERLQKAAPGSDDQRRQSLAEFASDAPPTLAYAIAGKDSITIASNTDGGPFGLGPGAILGMPNALDMQHIIQSGLRNGKGN